MIIIVMGVCGVGKSTVAQALSDKLHLDFLEGDSFHSEANVKKMSSGVPLTEEDRIPWLQAIRTATEEHKEQGVIVTCSALSRNSRVLLATERKQVKLVFLYASESVLAARMAARQNHFMPPELLRSQFETLQTPTQDEALHVCVEQTPTQVIEEILTKLS